MRCKVIMQVPSSRHCFYNMRIFSVLTSVLNFAWRKSDPTSQVAYAREQRGVRIPPLARLPGQDRTSGKARVRSRLFAGLLNSCHFKCFSCFCDQKEAASAARSLPEQTSSGLLWPAPQGSWLRCVGTGRRSGEGNGAPGFLEMKITVKLPDWSLGVGEEAVNDVAVKQLC